MKYPKLLKLLGLSLAIVNSVNVYADTPAVATPTNQAVKSNEVQDVCSTNNITELDKLINIYKEQLPDISEWKQRISATKNNRIQVLKDIISQKNINSPKIDELLSQMQSAIDATHEANLEVVKLKEEIIEFYNAINWKDACSADKILQGILPNLVRIEILSTEATKHYSNLEGIEETIVLELSQVPGLKEATAVTPTASTAQVTPAKTN